jgi:uncharacterized protein
MPEARASVETTASYSMTELTREIRTHERMRVNYQAETAAAGRHEFVDLARAFALVGIAVVNVAFIAYPPSTGYVVSGLITTWDKAAWFAVVALFMFKSYTLFSFMFGVGVAHQMLTANRQSASFGSRYARRMVGLLMLGAINITCFFFGDVLVIYAIVGSLLYLFRESAPRTLIRWGVGFYAVQVISLLVVAGALWMGVTFAPEEMAQAAVELTTDAEKERLAFTSSKFVAAATMRFEAWALTIVFFLFLQGFGVFAFFLFGLAAVRNGLITSPDHPFWARARSVYLPIGIVLGIASAVLTLRSDSTLDPTGMFGLALTGIASPFATVGYLGLIAHWSTRPATSLRTFLARGGSATLTAYLAQGLLFSLIFSGYGLGWFEKFGAAVCTSIALLVAVSTIVFSSLWRTRFGRGPVESVLRRWTYLADKPTNLAQGS